MKKTFPISMRSIKESKRHHDSEALKYYSMMEDPFCPPATDTFLHHKYWAINEAVYVLTHWPKTGLVLGSLSPLPEEIKAYRKDFFLPRANKQFNPENQNVNNVFKEMKKSIDNCELEAVFCHLCKGVSYLLRPWDVIAWALLKGYFLPIDLQEALGVFQMSITKQSLPIQRKVRMKIVGQFLVPIHKTNVTKIIEDDLMSLFGIAGESEDKELKSPRKAMNELFLTKGKRGRQPKIRIERTDREYIPEAIPEVLKMDTKGRRIYHFPLFQLAMTTAVRIIIHQMDKKRLFKMPLDEMLQEFQSNEIVKLYLDESSEFVLKLALKFAEIPLRNFKSILTHQHLIEHWEFDENGHLELDENGLLTMPGLN